MQRKDRKIACILLLITMTIPYLYFRTIPLLMMVMISFVIMALDLYYLWLFVKNLQQKRFLKKVFEGKNICKIYQNKPFYRKRSNVVYYRLSQLKLLPLFDFNINPPFYIQSDDIRYLYQKGYVKICNKEEIYTIELVIS